MGIVDDLLAHPGLYIGIDNVSGTDRRGAARLVVAPLVIADTQARSASILYEGEPGVFEPRDEPVPYPMKVVLSVPEPGRLRHAWWYASPGDQAVERDVSDLRLNTTPQK